VFAYAVYHAFQLKQVNYDRESEGSVSIACRGGRRTFVVWRCRLAGSCNGFFTCTQCPTNSDEDDIVQSKLNPLVVIIVAALTTTTSIDHPFQAGANGINKSIKSLELARKDP